MLSYLTVLVYTKTIIHLSVDGQLTIIPRGRVGYEMKDSSFWLLITQTNGSFTVEKTVLT